MVGVQTTHTNKPINISCIASHNIHEIDFIEQEQVGCFGRLGRCFSQEKRSKESVPHRDKCSFLKKFTGFVKGIVSRCKQKFTRSSSPCNRLAQAGSNVVYKNPYSNSQIQYQSDDAKQQNPMAAEPQNTKAAKQEDTLTAQLQAAIVTNVMPVDRPVANSGHTKKVFKALPYEKITNMIEKQGDHVYKNEPDIKTTGNSTSDLGKLWRQWGDNTSIQQNAKGTVNGMARPDSHVQNAQQSLEQHVEQPVQNEVIMKHDEMPCVQLYDSNINEPDTTTNMDNLNTIDTDSGYDSPEDTQSVVAVVNKDKKTKPHPKHDSKTNIDSKMRDKKQTRDTNGNILTALSMQGTEKPLIIQTMDSRDDIAPIIQIRGTFGNIPEGNIEEFEANKAEIEAGGKESERVERKSRTY